MRDLNPPRQKEGKMNMPKFSVCYSGTAKNSLYEKKGNESLSALLHDSNSSSKCGKSASPRIDRSNFKCRKVKPI